MNETRDIERLKKALLSKKLNQGKKEGVLARKREMTQPIPLSFAQKRLWFMEQLQPNTSYYTIPLLYRLSGDVDCEALKKSFEALVKRHEILRTKINVINGEPFQVVGQENEIDWEQRKCNLKKESDIIDILKKESEQSFDFEKSTLVRVRIVNTEFNVHFMLIHLHHLVTDGWSNQLILQEVSQFYQHFTEGKELMLPETSLQYGDYTIWEKERFENIENANPLFQYWLSKLENAPQTIDLPYDYPKGKISSFKGKKKIVPLKSNLIRSLKRYSEGKNATLFMTLLAAFNVLIYRLSHQNDFLIGVPVTQRYQSEWQSLVGLFVNTVVLRINVEENECFDSFLQRVKTEVLESFDHQELPFEKIVEKMQIDRTVNQNPLFQTAFSYKKGTHNQLSAQGLLLEEVEIDLGTSKLDLNIVVEEYDNDEAIIGIEYSTEVFQERTINLILESFTVILEEVARNTSQPLFLIPLISGQQKTKMVTEWNENNRSIGIKTIHQYFEEQAIRTPDATALIYNDEKLSYMELNNKVNQLGRYLRAKGLKPNQVVGICLERSMEMIIASLGVLKSGAAYLPLDPSYPQERLEYMVDDTEISLLLTSNELQFGLEEMYPRVSIEEIPWETLQKNNLKNVNSLSDLAYCIYTSGSTGRPKGVMVPHRGLANFAVNEIREYGFSVGTNILHHASFSFDASIYQLMVSLLQGATLYIADKDTVASSEEIIKAIQKWEIKYSHLSPSVLKTLQPNLVPGLEVVMSFGEALTKEVAEKWSQDRRFFNGYGPTETTIGATFLEYNKLPYDKPPIGKPIPNYKIYLLDKWLQPVPPGMVGEIYIGGPALAWGYKNKAELTAKAFIPNPFSAESERMYKTGDLGKFHEDGNLEFISRNDNQVKVRGFRIDLDEIENLLREHTDVKDVVVLPDNQCTYLIAYYIEEKECSGRQLRSYLSEYLPHYMIPSFFIKMQEFPLTLNGKLNRKALPDPDIRNSEKDLFAEPRTELEERLADIWMRELKAEKIGVNDNFFEIGGHSLLATKVVANIREQLSILLPLRSIFDFPTVSDLAKKIEESDFGTSDTPKLKVIPRELYR
jgi:amino acid adenylation domain-containing protein